MNWQRVYDVLAHLFPALSVSRWWGIDDPYERSWGCVLVQNTTWHNASLALNRLREHGLTSIVYMSEVKVDRLAQVIRPAGFYSRKAETLKRLAAWWVRHGGVEGVESLKTGRIRRELLGMKGIGEETADTLLLYVLDRKTFIGDQYSRRFVNRVTGEKKRTYDAIRREVLAAGLKTHDLQLLHAYIVEFGKQFCRKRNPDCPACPFAEYCHYSFRG